MCKSYGLICLLVLTLVADLSAGHAYTEYWQQFFWKSYENEHFAIRTYMRLETGNHLKKVRSLFLSEQFVYKVSKALSFEAHYSYIHGYSLTSPAWRWQNRLELEANKIFFLAQNCQIITRNRLEFRWRENIQPQPDVRFRHRALVIIPLEDVKPLKAFSFFNEVFFDLSRGFVDQDRFCPFQLTFEVAPTIDLDLFLMVRLFEESAALRKSIVLGTQLNF